jgi:hypothetical protein
MTYNLADLFESVVDRVAGRPAIVSSERRLSQLVCVEALVRSPAGKADYRWAREVASRALGGRGA